jgi:hypothetical protein
LAESEQSINWFNGIVFWLKVSSQLVLLQFVLLKVNSQLTGFIANCFD